MGGRAADAPVVGDSEPWCHIIWHHEATYVPATPWWLMLYNYPFVTKPRGNGLDESQSEA